MVLYILFHLWWIDCMNFFPALKFLLISTLTNGTLTRINKWGTRRPTLPPLVLCQTQESGPLLLPLCSWVLLCLSPCFCPAIYAPCGSVLFSSVKKYFEVFSLDQKTEHKRRSQKEKWMKFWDSQELTFMWLLLLLCYGHLLWGHLMWFDLQNEKSNDNLAFYFIFFAQWIMY